MKMIYRKAASLTLLASIWIGIIACGILIHPDKYQAKYNMIATVADNPVGAIPIIIQNAFSPANILMFGGILVTGVILSTSILGSGMSTLFSIPLVIIFAMVQMFVLPTANVMLDAGTPDAIKIIYGLFMGGLTILTAITFTSGRN